jgi:lysozyme
VNKENFEILKAELERDEGLKLKPYKDTKGILTIGIGKNLESAGISRDEAFYMLTNDINEIFNKIVEKFPWFLNLNYVRQRVLINIAFNVGFNGFLKFEKMLNYCKIADFSKAADEILDSKAGKELIIRYKRLSNMMRLGVIK